MVTLNYARTVEQRVNDLLAQGNIEAAQRQAENITGGGAGVQNALNRINTAIGAASDARVRVEDSQRPRTPTSEPETPAPQTGPSAEDLYWQGRATAEEAERRNAAIGILRDALAMYGLTDLVGDIDNIVRNSGNDASVALNAIRQTQAYKDRFKGLLALQQRGITDIANEADYINLESEYRGVFRDAGLQSFLGAAGSGSERDAIAKIVGDFSLSVNEVRDRVADAQRVVAQSPESVRSAFQQYYNVDPATLTAYVLDPVRTSSEINRRANAAIVGGLATGRGLTFGAGVAERIGEFASGGAGGDLSASQIEPALTGIAQQQRATGRLAALEGSILSDEETALAELDLDIEAGEKIRGLQSRERARFGGQAGLSSRSLSRRSGV